MSNTSQLKIAVSEIQTQPQHHLPKLPSHESYQFHSMIKPSGSQCNIDCQYCFYLHKEQLLDQPSNPRMSDTLLEQHIRQYIDAQTGSEVVFSWQGGEPMLMGLDFYKQVVKLQNKYKKPEQAIYNDLQTNGLLIDEKWCQFLKEQQFLVGLSIDGSAKFHNEYRRTNNDKPTHHLVMRAIALLHQYGIPFNALCVVNAYNSQYPLEVYRFLRDEVSPKMIQFSACVEPLDFKTSAPDYLNDKTTSQTTDKVTHWSVTSQGWGKFLATVWDEWLAYDYGEVFVDQFENTVSQIFGYGAQKCTTAQICGKALAIEHNGDVYSCDHFVYPEFKLGNINDTHEGDLAFSKKQEQFAFAKYQKLTTYCQKCPYLQLCWGECPKNRFTSTPDGEQGLNYLCQGLKIFYQKVVADYPVLSGRLQ